jgi:hypothetical protein
MCSDEVWLCVDAMNGAGNRLDAPWCGCGRKTPEFDDCSDEYVFLFARLQ